MNPEFLPELALLIAGLVVGAVGVHRLSTRHWVRALQLGTIAAALFALGILSGTRAQWHHPERWRSQANMHLLLVPGARADALPQEPGAPATMSLVLGGVPVQAVTSNKYVLSANGEEFLTIDSPASGLSVTCDVAGSQDPPIRAPRRAAQIRHNAVIFSAPGVLTKRPDASTILVQEGSREILRIHYVEPHRIEVAGQFYLSEGKKPRDVVLKDGLYWPGGEVAAGLGVDLRPQGQGCIEFAPSGAITVVRR